MDPVEAPTFQAAGLQFGVMRIDPLTKKPTVSTELDWNQIDAQNVVDAIGGEIIARPVGSWFRLVNDEKGGD